MSNGGQDVGDGHAITLGGVTYAKGLGVNSPSQIVYDLNGAYSSFLCDVGVDAEEGANGSVVFQVYADGVKVYDSGTVTGGAAARSLNLDMTGVKQLTLVVTDAGDGPDYDHADWAGATPVRPAGGVARPRPHFSCTATTGNTTCPASVRV